MDSELNKAPLPVEIVASRDFVDWMAASQISLALTTYQSSRLMLLGASPQGQLSGFERIFDRAMGLYAMPDRLYLSSKYQIWQLDNVLEAGHKHDGYDGLFVPRIGYTTGDLDIHDLAIESHTNRIVFISTLLNCLATVSDRHSCLPLWKPPFISRIINEDRCHLNGLAMVDGKPRYVTACSRSDVVDGWREKRTGGGIVMDISSNQIIATGLSMPHSPRWYQGKLWLLNAGTGEFGYIQPDTGVFQAVTFCPGFLRGLAFVGDYAIVGLSKSRGGDKTFSGLQLDQRLAAKEAEPRCGLMIIDINSGNVVHWVRLEGEVTELYDVQVLHGKQRPMALGFRSDEISRTITVEPMSIALSPVPTRPSSDLPPLEVVLTSRSSQIKPRQYWAIARRRSRFNTTPPIWLLVRELNPIAGILLLRKSLKRSRQTKPLHHWTIAKHDKGGFFSNFNKVLQLLKAAPEDCDITIDWTFTGTEPAFRYGDKIGENIWEQFFAPLPLYSNRAIEATIQADYLDYSLTGAFAHLLYLNPDFAKTRREYAQVYRRFIQLQPDIRAEVDRFVAEEIRGRVCIGIHKRHLLHWREEFYCYPLTTEDFIPAIRSLIAQFPDACVFLATDEAESIALLQPILGDRLIYQPQVSRQSTRASAELHWEESGSALARQVLIDALILSRCQVLVHGLSNVSTAIALINPDLPLIYLYKQEDGLLQVHNSVTSPPSNLDPAQALWARGRRAKQVGVLDEAVMALRAAIRIKPGFWGAHNNLGTLLQAQGLMTEAEQCYESALQYNPNFAEAIGNRASIWQLAGELERAKPELERSLQLKPDYFHAHINLAALYKQQGRLQGAIDHFQHALKLVPNYADAYFQLGQIFEYQDLATEALTCYQRVLELNPAAMDIQQFITLTELQLCEWSNYEIKMQGAIDMARSTMTGASNSNYTISPYSLNFFPAPLELHLATARFQAAQIAKIAAGKQLNTPAENDPLAMASIRKAAQLRIGYISPDFRDHAVGRLIYQIFPHHDRDRFEIYAYATTDVSDIITEQIVKGCDKFVNLAALTPQAAAQQIQDDGIDILIDLAGYTIGNGAPILAFQPAPIQAQFFGYPDTLGAEFIQYAIADEWLIPPEIAAYYTEKIIYLPHAFVGSSLEIANRSMSREEFGLPPTGFVFACFNTHRKINPQVFDAWMEILRQVPNSVLWLMSGLPQADANLRREAMARGIEGDRIIFSPRLAYAEYLARYQFVDLFLDTFIYSAGSTAIAALWAGVPILTRLGTTNASRMGASICAAAGLTDLICATTEAYIDKAIELAIDRELLLAMSCSLRRDRDSLPLFDVPGFTRNLEAAFEGMIEN